MSNQNEYLRASHAILKAQKERENSWTGKNYAKTTTECFNKAYTEANLSPELTTLLQLGDYWWNDIQDWATRVIAQNKES